MTLLESKDILQELQKTIMDHPKMDINDEMVAKYNFIYYDLLDHYNYNLGSKIVSRSTFLHHRTINNEYITHKHDEYGNHIEIEDRSDHHNHNHKDDFTSNFKSVSSLNADYYIEDYNRSFFDLNSDNFLSIVSFALKSVQTALDNEDQQTKETTSNKIKK